MQGNLRKAHEGDGGAFRPWLRHNLRPCDVPEAKFEGDWAASSVFLRWYRWSSSATTNPVPRVLTCWCPCKRTVNGPKILKTVTVTALTVPILAGGLWP
ncbi:hypothetical protein BpHYR1_005884, partial [Brachionus plicatilis]